MFFDTRTEEGDRQRKALILEIAALQRKLLLLRYEPRTRLPIPLKERKKGLFGREVVFPDGYQALCGELEEKRRNLTERLLEEGKPAGPYWWSLSWEELVPILLADLTMPEEEDAPDEQGRRCAYEFGTFTEEDGFQTLCLSVREHRQRRTAGKRRETDTVHSAYTASERKAMEQAYEDRLNTRMLAHMAFANKTPVYSMVSGVTYRTAAEYYSSGEGIGDYLGKTEDYSQSLYTVQKTSRLYASVESEDVRYDLGVARYHIDKEGTLDHLETLDFCFMEDGREGEKTRPLLRGKDSAVLCAGYLAYSPRVRRVPLDLFGGAAGRNAVSYDEARRQAEMITCLAGKVMD